MMKTLESVVILEFCSKAFFAVNINSFLEYFEILDPQMAETSESLLFLFLFFLSCLFIIFFSLIQQLKQPYTPLKPQKQRTRIRTRTRTRTRTSTRNRFGKFTYGRSFGQCQMMAPLKNVAIEMIQMIVYPMEICGGE